MLTYWLPLLRDRSQVDLASKAAVDAARVADDAEATPAEKARAAAVLGLALRNQGKFSEAKVALEKAKAGLAPADTEWRDRVEAALKDTDPAAYYVTRARQLQNQGKSAEAAAELDKAYETRYIPPALAASVPSASCCSWRPSGRNRPTASRRTTWPCSTSARTLDEHPTTTPSPSTPRASWRRSPANTTPPWPATARRSPPTRRTTRPAAATAWPWPGSALRTAAANPAEARVPKPPLHPRTDLVLARPGPLASPGLAGGADRAAAGGRNPRLAGQHAGDEGSSAGDRRYHEAAGSIPAAPLRILSPTRPVPATLRLICRTPR